MIVLSMCNCLFSIMNFQSHTISILTPWKFRIVYLFHPKERYVTVWESQYIYAYLIFMCIQTMMSCIFKWSLSRVRFCNTNTYLNFLMIIIFLLLSLNYIMSHMCYRIADFNLPGNARRVPMRHAKEEYLPMARGRCT